MKEIEDYKPSQVDYVLTEAVREQFPTELDFRSIDGESPIESKKDAFRYIAKNFSATYPENEIAERKMDDEEKEMLRKEYCYLQENVLVERKQQLEETMELIKTMKRDAEEAYSFTLSEIARYAADVKQGTREIRLRSTDTFCIALNGYYLTYVWDDDNQIFILAKAVPVADRSEIWSNESMNREAFLNAFGIEYPEVEKKEESLEMPFD